MTLQINMQERESDKTDERGSPADSEARLETASTKSRAAAVSPSQPYILLISASVLEREALSLVLEHGGFAVRSAGCDIEGIAAVSSTIPAIVLVEVPSEPAVFYQSWFNDLRRVFPDSHLVLLSESLNPAWLILCRGAGLSGYLTKTSSTSVIYRQLRLIAEGERILPITMLREIACMPTQAVKQPERPRIETLTRRDVTVLQYLVAGHSNKVIASRMQIAESTVKVVMKSVFAKIGVTNRTQAAVWALNQGLDKNTGVSSGLEHQSAEATNFR